ncbi:MAG: hypothetical protein PHQ65_09040 [Bacteroidales bacterium]|nr:hypothetical protein [Bacteroidales bacterium]
MNYNGAVVPVKFGMNAFYLFCEMRNIELTDVDKVFAKSHIFALRDLTFCAIVSEARFAGVEPLITSPEVVGNIMDEDSEVVSSLLKAFMSAKVAGVSLPGVVSEPTKKKKQR